MCRKLTDRERERKKDLVRAGDFNCEIIVRSPHVSVFFLLLLLFFLFYLRVYNQTAFLEDGEGKKIYIE